MSEKVKCGDCRHFKLHFETDKPDDDDLGRCTVMDSVVLPWTWRYATREVNGAWYGEEIECKRFERKDNENR